jgi:hypothetical protein
MIIHRKGIPYEVLIDPIDEALVAGYSWHIVKNKTAKTCYAVTTIGCRPNRKGLSLHRLIKDAGPGDEVDHKNQNGLDNRRDNLRFITRVGNMRNKDVRKDNKLGVRGVKQLPSGRYQRRIKINGIERAKTFDTIEEASISYEKLCNEEIDEAVNGCERN